MKEDFLHYVWKYQKFSKKGLISTKGESISIERVGQHNHDAGPDFFNAQVCIGEQSWAGNVEIHVKSSDWYLHEHYNDPAYDSVILHVVWEYNVPVFRNDDTHISTLELRSFIAPNLLVSYRKLFQKGQNWIYCEEELPSTDTFLLNHWLERLYIERLEEKCQELASEFKSTNNHWEALLFIMLAKNFGLKVNGSSFYNMAKSIDYTILKKCSRNLITLEALFYGQIGLLECNHEDAYGTRLQKEYQFLKRKFNLSNEGRISPKFFRLRPPNFPALRLSQLAALYDGKGGLFSEIIQIKNLEEYYTLFNCSASSYWDTHFNFGVSSVKRKKKLTKKFIHLLIVNTLIPLKFFYASFYGNDISNEVMALVSEIPPEMNRIIRKFNSIKPLAKSCLESQALLQLKNEYCDKKGCLQCAIGNNILKRNNHP